MVFGSIVGKKLIIFLFNKMVIFLVKNGYFLAGYSFGGLYFWYLYFQQLYFWSKHGFIFGGYINRVIFSPPILQGCIQEFFKEALLLLGAVYPGGLKFSRTGGQGRTPPLFKPQTIGFRLETDLVPAHTHTNTSIYGHKLG